MIKNKKCPNCDDIEKDYQFDDEFECKDCKKKFRVCVSFSSGNLIFKDITND